MVHPASGRNHTLTKSEDTLVGSSFFQVLDVGSTPTASTIFCDIA